MDVFLSIPDQTLHPPPPVRWQIGRVIIDSAGEAVRLFTPIFAAARAERVAVAHLDAGLRLIRVARPRRGDAGEVELPIGAILRQAIRLRSAAIVVAHNHPSGDPSPSRRDIDATRRLAATAGELGIRLHDHLIFAGRKVHSFRQLGLL